MNKTNRYLKNAAKQLADNLVIDRWGNPFQDICELNRELRRNTHYTFLLYVFISYSVVGILIFLKKLFRGES